MIHASMTHLVELADKEGSHPEHVYHGIEANPGHPGCTTRDLAKQLPKWVCSLKTTLMVPNWKKVKAQIQYHDLILSAQEIAETGWSWMPKNNMKYN